jgi:hypothetical protein
VRGVAAAGASPLMFSQRAVDKLKSRKTKPISFCWVWPALHAGGRPSALP